MQMKYVIWVLFITINFPLQSFSQYIKYPKDNPVELGKVHWNRNYNVALNKSKEKKLPLFILFQEVPGCSNCTTYGNKVLSHPLIVEIIETYFIPLCIYNNLAGNDALVLHKFNEPAWNNPVVRIIDESETDIVPRQNDFRSTYKTLITIRQALSDSGCTIPEYLSLLIDEYEGFEKGLVDEVYFGMGCFWAGEKEIGGLGGVIGTEAGYMYGKEVVKVTYRKDQSSLEQIVNSSRRAGCADEVFGAIQNGSKILIRPIGPYQKDEDDKYYLSKSKYRIIPMTGLQKTKVNMAIAKQIDPKRYLSPRQISLLNNPAITKSQTGQNMMISWWAL